METCKKMKVGSKKLPRPKIGRASRYRGDEKKKGGEGW